MKLVIFSDTHTCHNQLTDTVLPEADAIICSGDISYKGYKHEVLDFLEWFNSLKQYKYKIFIAGNHDFLFEDSDLTSEVLEKYPDLIYLKDSSIEIDGKIFYGSPVTPFFHNWAFNVWPKDLAKVWETLPEKIDVLITHGPPYGVLDKCISGDVVGDPFLLDKIKQIKPIIHCFGHIHESYGFKKIDNLDTIFINSSVLNEKYQVKNKPVIINI